jgi:hypothetical protein
MLKALGILWIIVAVVGYFALVLTSEHGGGLLSSSGWGEMLLIGIAASPGYGLIKLSERKK